MQDGPRHRQDQRGRRHLRRLRRQPQPRAVRDRDDADARGRRAAGADRQGDGRFRLPDGAVRGERPLRARHQLRHAQAPRGGRPELPQAARARPPGRDGAQGPEDRRRLVSLRERRPHAASRRSREERDRERRAGIRHRAAHVHRRRDPAPAAVRVGQRSLQDPRRRQGLPRERHRRDVAARLRLSALSRGAHVLGGHRRRAGDPRQISEWHERYGERWKPSQLLGEVAERGALLREATAHR